MIVTTKHLCKWRLKTAPNYVFSKDKCFNLRTGREIRQVYNNGSIGYNIKGKFRSLVSLRKELERIPNIKTPF